MLTGLIIGLVCLGLAGAVLVIAAYILAGWADEQLGYK